MTTYVAALGYKSATKFVLVESALFEAGSDNEAKEKANEWAVKNYHHVDDRTWLQVTVEGREIYIKQLGRS
jgi:predicted ribosome-associated RNA-binding protein Tma20